MRLAVRVVAVLPGVEQIEARVYQRLLDRVLRAALGAAGGQAARADGVGLRVTDAHLVVDDVEDDLVARRRALLRAGDVAARLLDQAVTQRRADRVRAVPHDREALEVRRRQRAAEEPQAPGRAHSQRIVGADDVVVAYRRRCHAAREQTLPQHGRAVPARLRRGHVAGRRVGIEVVDEQRIQAVRQQKHQRHGGRRDRPAVLGRVAGAAVAAVRSLRRNLARHHHAIVHRHPSTTS